MNETHDPAATSWVESANGDTDFPLQNLPFGVFRRLLTSEPLRAGVAIGDQLLDLGACAEQGLLDRCGHDLRARCVQPVLNDLIALEPQRSSYLRLNLHRMLRADAPGETRDAVRRCLVAMTTAEPVLPLRIGDYTDFFASIEHAGNVGVLYRRGEPLPPNYRHQPLAYHGRSSSIVVSRTPIVRPRGQIRGADGKVSLAPTRALDYEAEVGIVIGGPGNSAGRPIPVGNAIEHVFGYCLLNDWSARDIQDWESRPLGPFLSKSFATTISPWIVSAEALEPFRTAPRPRGGDDPPLLDYLLSQFDQQTGALDITLDVSLQSVRMRSASQPPQQLSRLRFASMYWTPAQMIAHHTINGCPLRPGDLLGSGTVSSTTPGQRGCLLELTAGGTLPFSLGGETRTYLEDGDIVTIAGRCAREGRVSLGFGLCSGRVIS
jgi:fumarylacetoacetase